MADEIPDSSDDLIDVNNYDLSSPEMQYQGVHSIIIEVISSSATYNTWTNWCLIPNGKPTISPPEVKTEYVDLPGADGSLDYTEYLDGLKFKDRSGSWEFIFVKDLYEELTDGSDGGAVYSSILNAIHGKYCRITLTDDPDWHYFGRIAVSSWKEEEHRSIVTINYLVRPYKQKTGGQRSL